MIFQNSLYLISSLGKQSGMNYYDFIRIFFAWLFCCTALVRGQTISQLIAQTPQCAVSHVPRAANILSSMELLTDGRLLSSHVSSMWSPPPLAASPMWAHSALVCARTTHCSLICQDVCGYPVRYQTKSVSPSSRYLLYKPFLLTIDHHPEASSLLDQLCQRFPTDSLAPMLKILAIISIAIAVPSIMLRWVARYQSSKLGWDDYTALGAAVCVMAIAAIQLASKFRSLGKGQFCLP